MYKERIITKRLKWLAENFPVVVVSGARQVSKSTLLQYTFPERKVVVFDPVNEVAEARQDPEKSWLAQWLDDPNKLASSPPPAAFENKPVVISNKSYFGL